MGCLFGGSIGIAVFALLPLAAFVLAGLVVGIWAIRRAMGEWNAASDYLAVD